MNKFTSGILVFCLLNIAEVSNCQNKDIDSDYEDTFSLDSCTFSSEGRNLYFILEPGYRLILQNTDEEENEELIITVLNETRKIGNVETRVVEERESTDGNLKEISRNFFAYCRETGDIYYFGEEVDIYKDGKIKSHSGAWIAEGNNKAGLIMPGDPQTGFKYFEETAPGVAMDRAEIISLTETYSTPAGNFSKILRVLETSSLDKDEKEYKLYAPGIGLIKDEDLVLLKYGFIR